MTSSLKNPLRERRLASAWAGEEVEAITLKARIARTIADVKDLRFVKFIMGSFENEPVERLETDCLF